MKNAGLTVAEARQLYVEYRSATKDAWGPYVQYDAGFQSRIVPMHRRMAGVMGQVVRLDDNTHSLPSAWHTALLLLYLQFYAGIAPLPTPIKTLYRGQANDKWLLTPTRHRLSAQQACEDDVASWLFHEALRRHIRGIGRIVDTHGSYSLARHYGLSSHLLDFTGDPAVAVWFACNDRTVRSGHGKVFTIPLSTFMQLGGTIFAPPPFDDRMARQIAVALDTRNVRIAELGRHVLSFVFPLPSGSDRFVLVRDAEEVDLLAAPQWIDGLAQHCRTHAEGGCRQGNTRKVWRRLSSACAREYPPPSQAMNQLTVPNQVKWLVRFVDWLYWVVIGATLDEQTGQAANLTYLTRVIRANELIARFTVHAATQAWIKRGNELDLVARHLIEAALSELEPGTYARKIAGRRLITPDQRDSRMRALGIPTPRGPNPEDFVNRQH